MRGAVITIAILAILAVGAGGWWWGRVQDALLNAPGGSREVVVVVEPGDGPVELVRKFLAAGVLKDDKAASWYADTMAEGWTFRPGEYAVSTESSPLNLFRQVEQGKVIKHEVLLSPGHTALQAFDALAAAGLAKSEELFRQAQSPELLEVTGLARVGAGGLAIEGRLLPEPYTFAKGRGASELLIAIIKRHKEVMASLPRDQREVSDAERLIVASLIEKAAVPPAERRTFAALLYNRLEKKKALKVEATTEYAKVMAPNHLKLWDTMKRKGLPPTAICNPSFGAMKAAFKSASSDALYMVARGNGTHVYCPDKACYRRAKRQWKDGLPPIDVTTPRPVDIPVPEAFDPPPYEEPDSYEEPETIYDQPSFGDPEPEPDPEETEQPDPPAPPPIEVPPPDPEPEAEAEPEAEPEPETEEPKAEEEAL